MLSPGLALLDRLSRERADRMAANLGSLAYAADRRRRDIACANIRLSGIATNEAEVRRIAKASFRHFGRVVKDSLTTGDLFEGDDWHAHIDLELDPACMELLNDPHQGVILASGHLGNWEVAAHYLTTLKTVTGVARPMNNPYADALMHQRKQGQRLQLIPKHDISPARFFTALKSGGALALLIDQHARRKHGMMIDFFGAPASTHTSPAMLHLVTGAPLCFGYCVEDRPGHFLFKTPPPITIQRTGNREHDVRQILTQLTRHLEEAIRAYPEQYLWAHRRWRSSTKT